MTHSTSAIFAKFVDAFKELADPDEGVTEARITPIIGNDVNAVTLKLVSSFISKLFFEDVEVGAGNYVCLAGIRLPFSAFTFLKELESGSYDLRILANDLATIKAGDSFPESFVPASYLTSDQGVKAYNATLWSLLPWNLNDLVEAAVIGVVNSSQDESTEHSLRPSLPGGRH